MSHANTNESQTVSKQVPNTSQHVSNSFKQVSSPIKNIRTCLTAVQHMFNNVQPRPQTVSSQFLICLKQCHQRFKTVLTTFQQRFEHVPNLRKTKQKFKLYQTILKTSISTIA